MEVLVHYWVAHHRNDYLPFQGWHLLLRLLSAAALACYLCSLSSHFWSMFGAARATAPSVSSMCLHTSPPALEFHLLLALFFLPPFFGGRRKSSDLDLQPNFALAAEKSISGVGKKNRQMISLNFNDSPKI